MKIRIPTWLHWCLPASALNDLARAKVNFGHETNLSISIMIVPTSKLTASGGMRFDPSECQIIGPGINPK